MNPNPLCAECGIRPATDDGLCRGCAAREAREEHLTGERREEESHGK